MEQSDFYSHVKKKNLWVKDDLFKAILQQRYHEFKTASESSETMPRLIHFIWLGPKPVPATFAAILEMWRKHHSDFEIKVWGEDDLLSLELANPEVIMDTQLNPALRSDFLRLELLF